MNWYENVVKDEVPPEYLWEDPQGLEMWWASVQEKRGIPDARPSGGGDERPSEMESNELTRAFRGE